MDIKRNGAQPSDKGPAEWFTGTVRIDPLFIARAGAGERAQRHVRARRANVVARASIRPNVTCDSRVRRVQRWGGPVEEIRPGDVVWIAPGEKHWHGAAPTTAMTHIAIQERLDGKAADWMEQVSDEQYQG